jgi:hypothetical protein
VRFHAPLHARAFGRPGSCATQRAGGLSSTASWYVTWLSMPSTIQINLVENYHCSALSVGTADAHCRHRASATPAQCVAAVVWLYIPPECGTGCSLTRTSPTTCIRPRAIWCHISELVVHYGNVITARAQTASLRKQTLLTLWAKQTDCSHTHRYIDASMMTIGFGI